MCCHEENTDKEKVVLDMNRCPQPQPPAQWADAMGERCALSWSGRRRFPVKEASGAMVTEVNCDEELRDKEGWIAL